jgi:HIV Tat-specific factor 1
MSTIHPPSALAGSSAEAQAAAFASDPRIYFSKESQTWRFEDDDGMEMEYDSAKGAWVESVRGYLSHLHFSGFNKELLQLDEDLLKAQQAAYSVAGVDEEASCASAPPTSYSVWVLRRQPFPCSHAPIRSANSRKTTPQ